MNKKIVIFIVMFFVVIFVLAISAMLMAPRQENIDDGALIKENNMKVSVVAIESTNIEDIVAVIGLTAPLVTVSETVEQAGRISSVHFDKGDFVKKGEILISIQKDTYEFRREQAKAHYDKAKSDLERWEQLKSTGSVSAELLDEKRTDMLAAKWTYELANLAYEQCEVKASISGYVQDRFVDQGEYVSPGIAIADIKDLSVLKVEVNIPEKDIFSIKLGEELQFTVDALGGQEFMGVVTFIAPEADRKTNTFKVELEYNNSQGILKSGIIVRVSVKRKEFKNVIVVPLSALVVEKGYYIAYTVENGEAVRNVVRLLQIVNSQAVVDNGLKLGDKLIVQGQRMVSDGTTVDIVENNTKQD